MKIGFIALSGVRVVNQELLELGLTLPGFVERKKVIASLPSLGLLTLAGLTSSEMSMEYVDLEDFSQEDDLPGEYDLVAISSFTAQIYSAYALANAYKHVGTKVVMGGLHVSSMQNEALKYCDSVVIGEGENCWEELLHDFNAGQLKKIYDGTKKEFDFHDAPMPRFDILDIKKYNRLTVQTQRGCPYQCDFCASSILLTKKYKQKPIDKVIGEVQFIKSIWKHPFIELADDNSFANRGHAKKLIEALSKENIKWFTETDISIAEDDELLTILGDSGCRQLLIGLESLSQKGLHNIEMKKNWKEKQIDKYLTAINKIQSKGISVNGCFVLGMDGDNEGSFDDVFQFVKQSGLSEVQITIATPFPGTPFYTKLKEEKRLIQNEFWDHCTLFDVNFYPKQMSAQTLESKFKELMAALYTKNEVKNRKHNFLESYRKSN